MAVLGIGTGGLIARVALREMELQGCCHHTRMFTSFDSPHQGMNIPLGIQAFLESTSISFNTRTTRSLQNFYKNVVKSPLFEELVIYNFDSDAKDTYDNLQDYLNTIGMPQGSRNFAIISGSDEGVAQKDNSNVLFMQPDSSYFTFKLGSKVPTAVNFTQGFNTLTGNLTHEFILGYASPKVLDQNNTEDLQIILERGDDIRNNKYYRRLYMNNWRVGMVIYTASTLAYVAAIAAAIVTLPPLAVVIEVAKGISIPLIQGFWNAVLTDISSSNQSKNPHPFYSVYNPYATQSLDIAPGGRNDFSRRVHNLINRISGSVIIRNHSLVSTISALNMDTTNLFMNVRADKRDYINDGLIPFEDYHSPTEEGGGRDNETHTLLTENDGYIEGNIEWFVSKLELTRSPVVANSQSMITLQGDVMNYGVPFDETTAPEKHLRNTEILSNGKVGINTLDFVGASFDVLYNQPANNSRFLTTTQAPECGGTYCKIDSLGVLQLGEFNSTTNEHTECETVFLENSVLEIMSDGKLIIERNSKLIIEEGATLIVHPGAEIFLNGANSVLEIKGKVELKDSAVFTFTSDVPGNHGYVIFNQRDLDDNGQQIALNEYWGIGKHTQFVIESQTVQGSLGMVCLENFRNTGEFEFMGFKNATIQFAPNKGLGLLADTISIEGVLFDELETGEKHGGVGFLGMHKENAFINNSRFKNGSYCVTAFQIFSQLPLRFENCTFEDNDTSLVVYNGAFELFNCNFTTSDLGVYSNNASKTSRINHSYFDIIDGVRIEGDESADLKIHESEFISSTTSSLKEGIAVNSFYVDISSTCSEYTQYDKALIANDCMIHLGDLAVNHFTNNDTAVLLSHADGINVFNGENDFESNGIDIFGSVKDLSLTPTVNINGALHVSCAHNNKLFVNRVVSSQPLSGFIGNASLNPAILPLFTSNSGLFVQMCENAQGYEPVNPFEPAMNEINSIELDVEVLGSTYNFIDALLLVTEDVYGNEEYEPYLLEAISDIQIVIYQAIEEINESMSDDVKMAYIIALKMNLDLLRMAYDIDLIEVAGGDPGAPVNSYVSNLSQYIYTLVEAIDGHAQSDYEERAIFEIMRAHVYRLAENHQQGIDVLMNLNGNYTNQTQDRIDFWNCVMSWEQDALVGNIMPDELQENIIGCYMMFNPHIAYNEEDRTVEKESVNLNSKISVYPNPTSDFLYFRSEGIAELDDDLIITITDTKGKQVYFNTEVASFVMRMDISNLAQGSYVLTVNTPSKRHNATFTVVR